MRILLICKCLEITVRNSNTTLLILMYTKTNMFSLLRSKVLYDYVEYGDNIESWKLSAMDMNLNHVANFCQVLIEW